MRLKPVDTAGTGLALSWLASPVNSQWLDFGNGHQPITPVTLKLMLQRDTNLVRVFTGDADETPIGLVALSSMDRHFKTAMLWYVLGDKSYGGRRYTTRAASLLLDYGFRELGLWAVNAWAVDQNTPSIRVLEANGFRPIGRQRQCHYVNGRACDRLLFDLLASEHKECGND